MLNGNHIEILSKLPTETLKGELERTEARLKEITNHRDSIILVLAQRVVEMEMEQRHA